MKRWPTPRACAVALAVLVLTVTAPLLAAAPPEAPVVPPMELPQVRIDGIDASAWPQLRVLVTVLDAAGHAVQPKALKRLAVVDAKRPSAVPLVTFRQGKPDEAQKSAKLQPRDKAGVPLAAMVVVAGYQHEALRGGTLGPRLRDALAAGWKQFAKGDRVNAIWYGDRLYRFHALKGHLGGLDDIETRQEACQGALAEARAGLELSEAPGDPADAENPPPPPGTWLCGLQSEAKTVGAALKTATFKGHFPRLFALGPPFYDVKRTCAPPPEELEGFGPFTASNVSRQQEAREKDALAGKPLPYEGGALDAAIQTLLLDSRPEEQPVIVIVSDGRDGYFRELELCEAHPPRSCQGLADRAQVKECIGRFLDQRVAAAQMEFRARAAHWLGLLRAAGIRVFAVGLGAIGRDFELDRLRLLAERSGGTWRLAASEDAVGPQLLATFAELSSQLVLDFAVATEDGAERPERLTLAVEVELDSALARVKVLTTDGRADGERPKARSLGREAAVPAPQSLAERLNAAARSGVAQLQEKLGYRLYLALCWTLAVVAALLLVGLAVLAGLRLRRKRRQVAQAGGR